MRIFCLVFVLTVMAGSAGFAQPAAPAQKGAAEKPIDNGPVTPGADNAYQGGGVTLQGAPGAPAPKPEATPSGQTPSQMVQPK